MLRHALTLILLTSPAVAAPAASPKPVTDAPVELSELTAWHAARLAEAAQGTRTLVRIPLVRRSEGWGCVCPDWYIGDSPGTYGGSGWLKPTFTAEAVGLLAKIEKTGILVIAEGYYSGKNESFVWKADGAVRATYEMAGFVVQRWRMPRADEELTTQVLLRGPKAQETVAPIADDRPWLVIAHSLKLSSPSCTQGAELRRKRLIEKGFKDAEVIDSRAAPLLACCFKSVLLGRFQTRAEAKALEAAAKAKSVRTYVRRGW